MARSCHTQYSARQPCIDLRRKVGARAYASTVSFPDPALLSCHSPKHPLIKTLDSTTRNISYNSTLRLQDQRGRFITGTTHGERDVFCAATSVPVCALVHRWKIYSASTRTSRRQSRGELSSLLHIMQVIARTSTAHVFAYCSFQKQQTPSRPCEGRPARYSTRPSCQTC